MESAPEHPRRVEIKLAHLGQETDPLLAPFELGYRPQDPEDQIVTFQLRCSFAGEDHARKLIVGAPVHRDAEADIVGEMVWRSAEMSMPFRSRQTDRPSGGLHLGVCDFDLPIGLFRGGGSRLRGHGRRRGKDTWLYLFLDADGRDLISGVPVVRSTCGPVTALSSVPAD